MKKMEENLFSTISNGTPPKDVATVILDSITKESPEHRVLSW